MDGFEWVAELKDQTTKPAQDIRDSLKTVAEQLVMTNRAAQKMGAGLTDVAEKQKYFKESTHESKESIFSAVLSAELWVEALKKVGEAALEAAKMTAEFVLEGAKMAIEAREFKEDMTDAYAAFRGSAEEGESTYKMVDQLAKSLPIPARQAHEMAKDLMVQGLENQAQIANTIQAVASLTQVQGEAAGGKLQNIINRSLASGKFMIKTKELTAVGGEALKGFYGTLAKQLGVSEKEIQERLAKGNIDVSQGIDAITSTINNGKIGALAAKQQGDLSVQAKKFKDNLSRLFDDIDTGPFLEQMRSLLSIFDQDTASGKTLKVVLTDTFNTLFEWATVATQAIYHGFLYAELYALKALNAMTPLIQGFKSVNEVVPIWDSLLALFKEIASTLAHIVVPPGLSEVIAGAKVAGKLGSSLTNAAKAAGADTAQGMAVGIRRAGTASIEAAEDLGLGVIDAAKDTLGIHSDSRKMMEVGKFTAGGFASGVVKNKAPEDAMSDMVRPPSFEAYSPQGGGKTITINVGGVEISGVPGVAEMGPMLETWFTDLLERVAEEAGG